MSGGKKLQIEENEGAATVKVSGEIDFTVSPELRKRLHEFIARTQGPVLMDLAGLEYMDSSGLAVFIEARRLLDERGRTLRITEIASQVKKVFQLTQVDQLFGL